MLPLTWRISKVSSVEAFQWHPAYLCISLTLFCVCLMCCVWCDLCICVYSVCVLCVCVCLLKGVWCDGDHGASWQAAPHCRLRHPLPPQVCIINLYVYTIYLYAFCCPCPSLLRARGIIIFLSRLPVWSLSAFPSCLCVDCLCSIQRMDVLFIHKSIYPSIYI